MDLWRDFVWWVKGVIRHAVDEAVARYLRWLDEAPDRGF